MTPKLVAFDLDGTLIGRDLAISASVRNAIVRMRARGVGGIIVTGRMYRAALPFARTLEFENPLICYQGAAIIDPSRDLIVRDMPLANAVVRDIISIASSNRMHLQLHRNDSYYCEQKNVFSDLYAALAAIDPVIVPSLLDAFAESDATKAVVVAEPHDAERYFMHLKASLGDTAYVTRSCPEFVEILNPAVDKGEALQFLAARLGVQMDAVLAIGDSWNDAPLLRVAGFGVAMGSAPAELRVVADAVVTDVKHDGVAEAIERYVLGERISA